jgi:hypothetical protein
MTMIDPEAQRRILRHVEAAFAWPLLGAVVLLDRGRRGCEVRYALPHNQVMAFTIDDVVLERRPDGSVAVLPLDHPEADVASLVPDGVVVATESYGLSAEVPVGDPLA